MMTDLTDAVGRLTGAIAMLEASLKAERSQAAEAAQALTAARAAEAAASARTEELTRNVDELRASSAAMQDEHKTALAELQSQLDSAAEVEGGVPDEVQDRLEKLEQACRTAEEDRDAAVAELEALREARSDDAKLRAEAAEALDAAIGELKILSGAKSDG